MKWPLNPNEVIIVRPVLQWVDFEHSAGSLAMGPLQREINLFHQLGVDLNLGSFASLG